MLENSNQTSLREFLSSCFEVDIEHLKLSLDSNDPWNNHWDDDVFFIDKWEKFYKQYPKKMHTISRYPKYVEDRSKFHQLNVFYNNEMEDSKQIEYFLEEQKFINVIKKLWVYSRCYVESNICFQENYPENTDSKVIEQLKGIMSSGIVEIDEWEPLESLLKLNLRDYIGTCLYFTELKLIIWPGDFNCPIYIGNESNIELLEKICTVEGVYLTYE